MKTYSKNGFTLVELLVVIAIIGMLSAALIVYVPGAIEGGRGVKCKANLKNLAQAVSSYTINRSGDDDSHMPTAGSYEWTSLDMSRTERGIWYHSSGAWVSWTPSGQWPYPSLDVSRRSEMTDSIFFDTTKADNNSKAFYSITNGVLWSYVNKDANVYMCDTHKRVVERETGFRVRRSYVMNHYFGCDITSDRAKRVDNVLQSGTASIRLLFAELPGQLGKSIDTSMPKADSVLDPSGGETLGFNHKTGKKWIAHVAFADGHVEGLVQPEDADLKDLAEHLCNGQEIKDTVRANMQ